jgi:hypothetical protein
MTLPSFVIIGAAKCGTSSLYEYVRAHPDVFMPPQKELQYFCGPFTDEPWLASTLDLGQEWYESNFAGAGDAIAIGEASTHYTLHPHSTGTAARMAATIPDARLVYIMRDPIERARSHYVHWVRLEHERRSVDVALRTRSIYLDCSRYAMQIEQYLEHFPREQLLLLRSEELRADRAAVLRRVFEFIGVDPSWEPGTTGEFNRAESRLAPNRALRAVRRIPGRKAIVRMVPTALLESTKRRFFVRTVDRSVATISEATSAALRAALRDDTARLRRYLGDDFDCWGIA